MWIDLQGHLELLDKLGGFESDDEEDEVSIEVIEREESERPRERQDTEITGATKSSRKLTWAEKREEKVKAWAWHLDHKREKERKKA